MSIDRNAVLGGIRLAFDREGIPPFEHEWSESYEERVLGGFVDGKPVQIIVRRYEGGKWSLAIKAGDDLTELGFGNPETDFDLTLMTFHWNDVKDFFDKK
jgi:hypothetical protein